MESSASFKTWSLNTISLFSIGTMQVGSRPCMNLPQMQVSLIMALRPAIHSFYRPTEADNWPLSSPSWASTSTLRWSQTRPSSCSSSRRTSNCHNCSTVTTLRRTILWRVYASLNKHKSITTRNALQLQSFPMSTSQHKETLAFGSECATTAMSICGFWRKMASVSGN